MPRAAAQLDGDDVLVAARARRFPVADLAERRARRHRRGRSGLIVARTGHRRDPHQACPAPGRDVHQPCAGRLQLRPGPRDQCEARRRRELTSSGGNADIGGQNDEVGRRHGDLEQQAATRKSRRRLDATRDDLVGSPDRSSSRCASRYSRQLSAVLANRLVLNVQRRRRPRGSVGDRLRDRARDRRAANHGQANALADGWRSVAHDCVCYVAIRETLNRRPGHEEADEGGQAGRAPPPRRRSTRTIAAGSPTSSSTSSSSTTSRTSR